MTPPDFWWAISGLQLIKGMIRSCNGITQKNGVYFPCDEQTVDTNVDNVMETWKYADTDLPICAMTQNASESFHHYATL